MTPDCDLALTEALRDLVEKHQSIIDKHTHVQGRPSDLPETSPQNIGQLVFQTQ
jgi:hypothetical protein